MKVALQVLLLGSLVLPWLAFRSDVAPLHAQQRALGCEAPVRLMPLGDSITEGVWTGSDPADPVRTGYRQPLYQLLTGAGYAIDFVGGERGGWEVMRDPDHEGHSGYTPAMIAYGDSRTGEPGIDSWLVANPPDIVLLHIGTNGLPANDPLRWAERTNRILDRIADYEHQYGRHVTVVLARIIKQRDPAADDVIIAYNNAIERIARERVAQGDDIVLVNMENALAYPADLHDNLHPNPGGYEKMANEWYKVLTDILPTCNRHHLYLPAVTR